MLESLEQLTAEIETIIRRVEKNAFSEAITSIESLLELLGEELKAVAAPVVPLRPLQRLSKPFRTATVRSATA